MERLQSEEVEQDQQKITAKVKQGREEFKNRWEQDRRQNISRK
jgi:hypothetical protein